MEVQFWLHKMSHTIFFLSIPTRVISRRRASEGTVLSKIILFSFEVWKVILERSVLFTE